MTLPGLHNKRDARTFHVRTCPAFMPRMPDYSTRCRLEVTVILVTISNIEHPPGGV